MASTETRNREFRVMLSKLDVLLREEDITRLKAFCKDYIRARDRDKITQGVALFEALEERNKLSPDDLIFLKEALESCCGGRSDVLDVVKDYEDKHAAFVNGNLQQGEDLNNVFDFLATSLGKEYKNFLRQLGISDDHLERLQEEHPRSVSEVIHKALVTWQKAKQPASVEEIVSALRARSVRRNDLAEKIEEGKI